MRTDLIILGNKGSNYTNPVLSATKSLLKHKCNLSIAFYTFNFLKQSKFTLLYKPWKYFEKFSKFLISSYRSKSKTMKSWNFPVSSIKRKKNQLTLKSWNNFGVFQVLDFCIRAKIENSENYEIFNFFQQNMNKSWNNLRALILKSKTRKPREFL